MQSLGNLLPKRLNQLGLNKSLQAARIVSEANKLAESRFTALSFSRGALTIVCPNCIVAQEAKLNQADFLGALNKKLGHELVTRLKFKITESGEEKF